MGAVALLALATGGRRQAVPSLAAAVLLLVLVSPGPGGQPGLRPLGPRHRGPAGARPAVAGSCSPRRLPGWAGRRARGARRGPGRLRTGHRRDQRARSACSPCRPTCSPRRRSRRRRSSASARRCSRRSACRSPGCRVAGLPAGRLAGARRARRRRPALRQPAVARRAPAVRCCSPLAQPSPCSSRCSAPAAAGPARGDRRGGGRRWGGLSPGRAGLAAARLVPRRCATSGRATRSSPAPARTARWWSTPAPTRARSTPACAGSASAPVPLVVLTHPHADHVDGLPGVLRGRSVGGGRGRPVGRPAAAGRPGRGRRRRAPGCRRSGPRCRRCAALGGAALERARADAAPTAAPASDPNNDSLVLRLEVAGDVVLLSGDVEPEAQADLLASGVDLRADVLKVPHHGSAYQDPGVPGGRRHPRSRSPASGPATATATRPRAPWTGCCAGRRPQLPHRPGRRHRAGAPGRGGLGVVARHGSGTGPP